MSNDGQEGKKIDQFELVRQVYPAVKMVAYGKGCFEVVRKCKGKIEGHKPERGKVKMQSKRSLIRLMFLMQCTEVNFSSMLTLTYPKHFPTDGEIVKQDLGAMVQKIRRAGWEYLWFLEFQKRGAPHIHIILDVSSISPRIRVDFGLYWTTRIALSDWYRQRCPVEHYEHEVLKMAKFNVHHSVFQLITHEAGARNYVTKYASKERQKKVPREYRNVGRFWGSSRSIKPNGVEFDITEDDLEQWLVDNGHPAADYFLVPRHLWGLGAPKTSVPTRMDALTP